MSFLDDLFGQKGKVLVKISYDDNSVSTWCNSPDLNRLPSAHRRQLKAFLDGLTDSLREKGDK